MGDRSHCPTHRVNLRQFFQRRGFQRCNLCRNRGVVIKDVGIFQQVGFIGQDLLHPQRPLLIPRARQAQRLVPSGQLHGTRTGVF